MQYCYILGLHKQERPRIKHMNSLQGIAVKGYKGKWNAVDERTTGGVTYYFMEHDYYGDETCYLVINREQTVVIDTYDSLEETLIEHGLRH